MDLYIDGDGCPVVDIALRHALAVGIKSFIVCDTAHHIYRPGAETIMVSKGADSVDFVIVNRVLQGDLVVTQDYGLAAMALSRGAKIITQNGLIIDNSNIDALLASRHLAHKLRSNRVRLRGPSKRTSKEDQQFEQSFCKLLVNL